MKIKSFPIWLFLLLIMNTLLASNSDSLKIVGLKEKANSLFKQQIKYDSILYFLDQIGELALNGAYSEEYMLSLLARYAINFKIDNFSEAEKYIKRCVNDASLYLDKDHPLWKTIYNSEGSYYSLIGDIEKSLTLQKKSLTLLSLESNSLENVANRANILQNIGTNFSLLGDFNKAISYYKEAANLALDSLPKDHSLARRISSCNYEIALEYKTLGRFQIAISYFLDNIEFTKNHNPNDIEVLLKTLISLADTYHFVGQVADAFVCLKQAELLRKKYYFIHKRDFRGANFYNIRARCYTSSESFDLAYRDNEKAIQIAKDKYVNLTRSRLTGRMHFFYGENLTKNQEWQKALEQFQLALIQFMSTYDSEDIFELPEKKDIRQLEEVTLKIFAEKSRVFGQIFKKTKDEKYLQAAWDNSQFWISLIDDYRDQLHTESSQLFISEQLKPGFEHAIKLALVLYGQTGDQTYLEKAFEISEKSKAVLLYASLNTIKAKYTASLPDSMLDLEHELSTKVSFYKKQIFNEGNKKLDCDDAKIKGWERKIFSLERQLDSLEQIFETDYPNYFSLKYENEPFALKELQQTIPNNQTLLLEYFVGANAVYIFALSKDTLEYRVLDKSPVLSQEIDSFLVNLHRIESKPDYIGTYRKRGNFLFKKLIGQKWANFETYIIIPDASLGLLPFELLLTGENGEISYSKLPYFFKDRKIHYAYSAQLLFDDPVDRETRAKPSKTWAGFAPIFEGAKVLNFNERELQEIQKIMQGDALVGIHADKASFVQHAKDYEILHFATHAYPNQENPQFARLEFTPKDSLDEGILYAHELMNQRLTAKLVVLSACETGYGAIAPGEGIMSLARSFRYAGSPSIVMSLWKAESSVSEQLMIRFYEHLDKGESKAEALRLAKLAYLSNPIPGREHPRYWANFVLIGDSSPIQKNFSWIWLFAFVVVFGFLGKTFYKRRR